MEALIIDKSENLKKLCIIQYNKYNLQSRDKFPKIFLLGLLTKRLEQKGYKVILLKSDYPKEINDLLERYKKIDLILNFEDYYIRFSRHFHSGLNLRDAYEFYKTLEKTGTVIYPPPDFHIYTNSKTYALEMYKNPEFVLPHSKVFLLKDASSDNIVWKEMVEHLSQLKKITDFSIIKVGYSADMADVYFINNRGINIEEIEENHLLYRFPRKQIITFNSNEDLEVIRRLYKEYITFDKLDLVVIIQPFNPIVANRNTEYRMWYINGRFIGYFCFGIIRDKDGKLIKLIDNKQYNSDNLIDKNLLELGNKLYKFIEKEIKNHIKKDDFKIIALRLDMSYATEDIFLDKYSIEIDGKKYRFYCNEIENIDGTYYLNLPTIDVNTGKKKDNSYFQYKLVDTIIDSLKYN